MRVSFEHLVTYLSRTLQLPFKGILLWKVLKYIIFDRQTCICEGCGQLLRFYKKKMQEKKYILSFILSSLTFLSKELQESYLNTFSITKIDVATWINTKMHLPKKRVLGSVCELAQQKSTKAEQASEKTILTAAHPV